MRPIVTLIFLLSITKVIHAQNSDVMASVPTNQSGRLTLDTTKASYDISTMLIGAFFEDINYSADGGLYAEMVQNRDFEYSPTDYASPKPWNHDKAWSYSGKG